MDKWHKYVFDSSSEGIGDKLLRWASTPPLIHPAPTNLLELGIRTQNYCSKWRLLCSPRLYPAKLPIFRY